MIEAATPSATREQPAPDPEFRVDTQEQISFVPTAIEVFRRDQDTEVHWNRSHSADVAESAMALLAEMVDRAKLEARRHPTSSRSLVNLGTSLLNAGQIEQAGEQFEAAYRLEPRNISALAHLARVRILQERYDEAERYAAEIQKADPVSVLAPILFASVALSRLDASHALEALTEAASRSPRDPMPEYLLGLVLIGQRRTSEAMTHLRKAARLNPRSAAVQHALGVAFGLKGEWSRAIRAFKTALTLAPRQRQTVLALSRVLMHRGVVDEAIAVLSQWIAREPGDREGQELVAHAYRAAGDARTARRHLTIALKSLAGSDEASQVDRARLMNNIGVCTGDLGDHEDASQWFLRSLQDWPTAVSALNLAKSYRELGRHELAHDVLESWLQREPSNGEAKFLLGIVAADLGRPQEAIMSFEKLIQAGEAGPEAYACLGWILSDERRDYERALRVLVEAREKFPNDLAVANNLAYVALMAGNTALADEVLRSVSEHDTRESVYLTATKGLLRLRQGDTETAQALYEAAESLARRQGRKSLAKTVKQKMHLEFARAYLDAGDMPRAMSHARMGLKVDGRRSYHADLRSTYEQIARVPQARSSKE